MMQTLIFTGSGGIGISVAAVATASAAAESGKQTLLASVGPTHNLSALLNAPFAAAPYPVAPGLDIITVDVLNEMSELWTELRSKMPAGILSQISGDELPLAPGFDLLMAFVRLAKHASSGYDIIIIDAGSHEGLLRGLAVPDSLRWIIRLLFGLDRGPGKSAASQNRALVPGALLPLEWIGQLQDARVQFEALRDNTTDASRTLVRYVLRPDFAALEDARLAIPALHLHGLSVDALLTGPLLPSGINDSRLAELITQQRAVAEEARNIWSPRPILQLPGDLPTYGYQHFSTLGAAVYANHSPATTHISAAPIEQAEEPEPFIDISLPGARRESLGLTISGDELIVRVGPYRRHLLLPEGLRNQSNIRARRDGERLVVHLQPPPSQSET